MGTGMAIRGVEASSSKTYMQEVRGAIRGCPTDVPLAKAVERRFGELALRKRGVSAAKNLVAGIRILERLELIPPTITDLHRLQLQAIGKMAKAGDRPRVWATMADFQTLAEHRVHWAWARMFFAVGMAFTLCLRVSDVAVLRWGWLGHANWMVFFDYKVAKEMCAQPIPPFWEQWRQWLYKHRRPHHHDDALVLPRGTDTLRKLQQEPFKGTECSLTGWHPWKRMGAACFRALGGSLQALTIWARWRTPRQAARYAAHPPAWKMPARVLLPKPTGDTGHFTRDCEWQWMPVRELWHADAFAWDAGRKRARQPPTVQSFARPITPEEVDSESDDDDVEDDEERPVDGVAEGHKTTQGPTTDACSGDSDGVVAGERVLEHGTVAAAGGRSREGGSADDDVEAVSPGGSVQRAANAGGDPPRATGTSGDGG